jgi:hypothetical protein
LKPTIPSIEGKSFTGLDNKKQKNRYQKQREIVMKNRKEKNPDIRAELKKSNIVEIFEEVLGY